VLDGEGFEGIGVFAGDDVGVGVMLVLRALKRETALPGSAPGPVEFRALRRFASIWWMVAISSGYRLAGEGARGGWGCGGSALDPCGYKNTKCCERGNR